MSYLAAILSGVLAAVSFPTIVGGVHFPDLYWLAWMALIPYLWALAPDRLGKSALQTILFGTFWNGLTSYWIFSALYFNGQLSWAASLGVLGFMAVGMGVIQAVFIIVALWLHRHFRFPLVFILPCVWTLFEWVRNYGPFGGYPWANLGYSQAPWLHLIQGADLVGVYGITFLIVLINVALVQLFRALLQRRRLPWQQVVVALVLVLACLSYGNFRLSQLDKSQKQGQALRVGLLQPNIGQEDKWKPNLNEFILELLSRMTHQATQGGAQLVIWPETALPTALPLHLKKYTSLKSFSVPVLLGILSSEPGATPDRPILYNSALQINPGGNFSGRMHKQHLVPLGEYVPLSDWLWFVEPVVPKIGDFRSVAHNPLLQVQGYPYGVTICYEDLFSQISRDYTREGASFLVNITNDAWYGDSSQLDQHLNFSIFRAVENRRALIRGTNTGYTAIITPTGRLQAQVPKFTRSILLAEIPLRQKLSPYTRWGDGLWIGFLALGLVISILVARRKVPKEPVA